MQAPSGRPGRADAAQRLPETLQNAGLAIRSGPFVLQSGGGSRSRPPWRCRRRTAPSRGSRSIRFSVGGHAAQIAEKDLAGPLRESVSALLSEGSHG
jgi:hypothetical protein